MMPRSPLSSSTSLHFAFALGLVLTLPALKAQTAEGYTFTSSTGVALAGLTAADELIGADDDDAVSALVDIGFTFVYEGVPYTRFTASTNGLIRLGDVAMSPVYGSNIASPNNTPRLMPLWADHTTNGGGFVRTSLEGSAPDRIRVVEWFVGMPYGVDANSVFQVLLHESRDVEFRYGAGVAPQSAAIAIGGVIGQDYISITPPTASSATTPNNGVAVWPGQGRSYVFAPFGSCPEPMPGATIASAASVCSGMSVQLNLEDPMTGLGYSYQWASSPDGVVWTDIPDAIEDTLSVVITASTYYACTVTCTISGESAMSTMVQVELDVPVVPYAVYDPIVGLAESMDTWSDLCSTSDVPGTHWRNTPGFGQNSWRRHDEGITTGGWTNSGWNPNMDPATGGAARFHSRGSAGLTGTLDWYVDMSDATGPTTISFRYINSAGGGRLVLQQSVDGGLAFVDLGDTLDLSSPPFNTWVDVERTATSTSATTVFRWTAIGPLTNTGNDIGVDSILIAADTGIGMDELRGTPVRTYPQPAATTLTVELPDARITQMRLLNGLGSVEPVRIQGNGALLLVDVSALAQGMYVLELVQAEGRVLRVPVLVAR